MGGGVECEGEAAVPSRTDAMPCAMRGGSFMLRPPAIPSMRASARDNVGFRP